MTKIDEKEKLTPVQMQAVNLLAVGESITSIAEKLKVSRQTVSGWANNDANFNEALWIRQYELWNGEIRRVRAMTSKALDVLYEALESEDYKARLTAAKMLISTLGLPSLIAQRFQPLQKEYWRPMNENEKEQLTRVMQLAGREVGDLSDAKVKIS
jgi:DNA-binding XRE family transcriptional regulator